MSTPLSKAENHIITVYCIAWLVVMVILLIYFL